MRWTVHQFHHNAAAGDAITNQMLAIRAWLQSEGHASEIYTLTAEREMSGEVRPLARQQAPADALWLVHHSIGFDGFEQLAELPGRKILIFHNITPPRFAASPELQRRLRQGWKQLADFRPHAAYALANSNYTRREMLRSGYIDVGVLPVQTHLAGLMQTKADAGVRRKLEGRPNWLFVGRVVPNKCHEDVIRAFAHYRRHHQEAAELHLVGDTAETGYVTGLKALAAELGVGERVSFAGKVSPAALKAYYETAGAFVCMSEHEGFCVPVLEAMAHDVPVFAYRASAVPETMAGAGVLLDTKEPEFVGTLVDTVLTDGGVLAKLRARQQRRLKELDLTDTATLLRAALLRVQAGTRQRSLQVEGSFETSYSLAIVNRRQAEAFDRRGTYDVSLRASDGYGDFVPQEQDLADKPHAARLWRKAATTPYPDVCVRNMYPPRVADMKGQLNFLGPWGWEESHVPRRFVEPFNRYLDGIGVLSQFVKEALEGSGATVPIEVVGCGVELPPYYGELKPYPLRTEKPIRFVHISSAFPRKGVDVLLKAYFRAFTGDDPVCLVLKTFPNPHNQVEEQLAAERAAHPHPPEVELINQDLPENELYQLYRAASALVHVARGEGFGLPVAEAMLARVPVIVSPNTGLADFCRPDTAVLVGYTMAKAQTHLSEGASMWAEPDADELVERLRAFAFAPETLDLPSKLDAAERLIASEFNWDRVAERWEAFIEASRARAPKPHVALVSTWACRCGIAEYAQFLTEATRDQLRYTVYATEDAERAPAGHPAVEPCWLHYRAGDMERLAERLAHSEEDLVHVQYNFGFFPVEELGALIERIAPHKPVLVTLHSTQDVHPEGGLVVSLKTITTALARAARVIVHQEADRERLAAFGLRDNVVVMAQGNVTYPEIDAQAQREALGIRRGPVVATFGFLLPHKGVREIIEAIALLRPEYPAIHFLAPCALHTNPSSPQAYGECQEAIRSLGLERHVTLVPDFLAPEECMAILQAADLTLLPYHPTQESSSAAVRFCLAALRPLITSREPIFAEVAACSQPLDAVSPAAIAAAIRHLLQRPDECARLVEAARQRVEATSWSRVGAGYAELVATLCAAGASSERRVPAAAEASVT